MTTTRGTTNRNDRGNTRNRAARRAYLLRTFGDGVKAPCYRCGLVLDDSTITVDRIVPGRDGGRYTRDNIRPACGPCNSETGGALARRKPRGKRAPAPPCNPDHTLLAACAGCGRRMHPDGGSRAKGPRRTCADGHPRHGGHGRCSACAKAPRVDIPLCLHDEGECDCGGTS